MPVINVGTFWSLSFTQSAAYQTPHSVASEVWYGDNSNNEGIIVFDADGSVTAAAAVEDDQPAGEIHHYVHTGDGWRERQADGHLAAFANGEVIQAREEGGQLKFTYKKPPATPNTVDWVAHDMSAEVSVLRSDSLRTLSAQVYTLDNINDGFGNTLTTETKTQIEYDPSFQTPTHFKISADVARTNFKPKHIELTAYQSKGWWDGRARVDDLNHWVNNGSSDTD